MTPTFRRGRGAATRFLIVSAALVAFVGCGGSRTQVTGKVTYKGQALPVGGVTLVAGDGTVYTGLLNKDGEYLIENVPTGSVQIAVVGANRAAGNKPPPAARGPAHGSGISRGKGAEEVDPTPPPPPPKGPIVPAEYADPRTSGLTGTVTVGQPLNIDIP